jgi:hypothetical protein
VSITGNKNKISVFAVKAFSPTTLEKEYLDPISGAIHQSQKTGFIFIDPPIPNGTTNYTIHTYEATYDVITYNLTSNYYNFSNASILYNNTQYNATKKYINNITEFKVNLSTPLATLNNTNITFNWTFNVYYSNGTLIETSWNSTTYNQSVRWGMEVTNFTTMFFETEIVTLAKLDNHTKGVNLTNRLIQYTINNDTTQLTPPYQWTAPLLPVEHNPSYNGIINYTLTLQHGTELFNRSFKFNATLYQISFINCSNTGNVTLAAYIFDEQRPTVPLNATMEAEFVYWSTNASKTKNYTVTLDHNFVYYICLVPGNVTIQADTYLKYSTENGFTHRYYLFNQTFNNASKVNLSIYNFNTTTGISELLITVRESSTYNYFSNVVGKLQRKYVGEGVWRTVQMDKSGTFGTILFNIEEVIAEYRIIFSDTNKNTLKVADNLKFVCTSGLCEITYTLSPYEAEEETSDIETSVSYDNSTSIITVLWGRDSGVNTNVRTLITKPSYTGITSICDTSQSGASGAVQCNVTGYSGNVLYTFYENGEEVESKFITLQETGLMDKIGGKEGAFWTVMILLVVMGVGLYSPVATVISTIIGLVIVYFLGVFTPVTLAFVIAAAVIGVVVGLMVKV